MFKPLSSRVHSLDIKVDEEYLPDEKVLEQASIAYAPNKDSLTKDYYYLGIVIIFNGNSITSKYKIKISFREDFILEPASRLTEQDIYEYTKLSLAHLQKIINAIFTDGKKKPTIQEFTFDELKSSIKKALFRE